MNRIIIHIAQTENLQFILDYIFPLPLPIKSSWSHQYYIWNIISDDHCSDVQTVQCWNSYTIPSAAAVQVFLKANSDGGVALLRIFEWLNLNRLQISCLLVPLLSFPVRIYILYWITCCRQNLPCISQLGAFSKDMFCVWSTVSCFVLFHGLFSVLCTHFLLLFTHQTHTSLKVSS